MNLRRPLVGLVLGLPVLLVAFAVIMGAVGISSGVGDRAAARVFWWVGQAVLLIVAVDLVLIVMILGWRAINEDAASSDESSPPSAD